MRIVLFCEQKYAINILTPIQEEALKSGHFEVFYPSVVVTRHFMVCPFPEYP